MNDADNILSGVDATTDKASLELLMSAKQTDSSMIIQSVNDTYPALPDDTPDENAFLNEFLGRDVLRLWEQLKAMVAQHEPAIRRLWKKKNRNQRARILMAAWGRMAFRHSPDMVQYLKDQAAGFKSPDKGLIDAFTFPYMNIEDLQHTRPLLLMIESRARYHPTEFLRLNLDASALGRAARRVSYPVLAGYDIDLVGESGSHYGRLWKASPDSSEIANKFGALHDYHLRAAQAVLGLQLQHQMLGFLIRTCGIIMEEKVPVLDPGKHTNVRQLGATMATCERKAGDWPKIGIQYLEMPYSAPKQADLLQLKCLFLARRQTAEHKVLDLREDPCFFFDNLKTLRDHDHRLVDTPSASTMVGFNCSSWTRSFVLLIESAHTSVLVWDVLCSQVDILIREVQSLDVKNPTRGWLPQAVYFEYIVLQEL